MSKIWYLSPSNQSANIGVGAYGSEKKQMNLLVDKITPHLDRAGVSFHVGDPDMTIQQVAEKMSFSDQSSFGKFFKKHTGLSPLRYRQNLKKTLLTLRPKDVLDEDVRQMG